MDRYMVIPEKLMNLTRYLNESVNIKEKSSQYFKINVNWSLEYLKIVSYPVSSLLLPNILLSN